MSNTYKDSRKAKARRKKLKLKVADSKNRREKNWDDKHDLIAEGHSYWGQSK